MEREEIEGSCRAGVGVLELPVEKAPAMRPLSFWFDGDSTIYFLYVLDPESRKEGLSDRAEAARFLVYRAETPFNWRSVLLSGSIGLVPDDEREGVENDMELHRRPDVFERASESSDTELYRSSIDERTDIKHLGFPSGFERT